MGDDILKFVFFILIFLAFHHYGYSASCCGGTSSLPSLIVGDYRGQFSLSYINSAVAHTVDKKKSIKKADANLQRIQEKIALQGAWALTDRLQVAASGVFVVNTHETLTTKEKTSSPGDASLQFSYEFLPEKEFSWVKPRGFLTISQVIPIGKSIHNSKKILQSDNMSKGFHHTLLGVALVKNRAPFDFQFVQQIVYYYPRKFTVQLGTYQVKPRPGLRSSINAGHSFKLIPIRLGLGLSFLYDGKKKIESPEFVDNENKYFWSTSIGLSYFLNSYSFSLSYADETVIGPVKNSTLSRSLSMRLNRFIDL